MHSQQSGELVHECMPVVVPIAVAPRRHSYVLHRRAGRESPVMSAHHYSDPLSHLAIHTEPGGQYPRERGGGYSSMWRAFSIVTRSGAESNSTQAFHDVRANPIHLQLEGGRGFTKIVQSGQKRAPDTSGVIVPSETQGCGHLRPLPSREHRSPHLQRNLSHIDHVA